MQGTQVQSLAEELRFHMPRGNEAHRLLLNLRATTRESVCRNKRSHMMQVRPEAAKQTNTNFLEKEIEEAEPGDGLWAVA